MNIEDLDPFDVAERLTMAGLEVEAVEYLGDELKNCVVAQILEVEPHPESNKLKVLKVSDGSGQHQVVCGAPNVEKDMKVALALPGAVLPDGAKVDVAEIRGVVSNGMLLSEIELGLVDETWGILELPDEAEVGAPLHKWVYMDDYVLEVGPTPNRGDCFGVLGVAREVAAIYKMELSLPEVDFPEELDEVEKYVDVEIEAPDLCPRYTARYIEGVIVDESALWMKVAVKAFGMRPISNIVDVTNYVLMEVGHPLHAFDFERLKEGKIVVRRAREGEYIVTLDGEYRELTPDALVIADGQRPVALAGIMGGANSEVARSTTKVLLESAYFDPTSIRRTSKRMGLSTEASKRFERGMDIETLVYAVNRATQLIVDLAGGKVAKGIYDVYPKPFEKSKVYLSYEKLDKLLGVEVPKEEAKDILKRLCFEVEEEAGGVKVRVPYHRMLDVTRDVDLVEEVARIWGYDKIPSLMPAQRLPHYVIESEYAFVQRVRDLAVNCGLKEAICYSFINPVYYDYLKLEAEDKRRKAVKLLNPLSEEMSVMRTTLLPGLLESAGRNHRVRVFDAALFEVGHVFFNDEAISEKLHFGFVLTGRTPVQWMQKPRKYDYFDAKGIVEYMAERLGVSFTFVQSKQPFLHPGQSADVLLEDRVIGFIGVLHPDVVEAFELKPPVVVGELDLEPLKTAQKSVKYKPIPKYPETTRDLSFIVPKDVSYDEIRKVVLEVRPEELIDFRLIDVYEGEPIEAGKVSMTLSFTFVSYEKTLSDEEVDKIFWSIAKRLEEKLPVKIRTR